MIYLSPLLIQSTTKVESRIPDANEHRQSNYNDIIAAYWTLSAFELSQSSTDKWLKTEYNAKRAVLRNMLETGAFELHKYRVFLEKTVQFAAGSKIRPAHWSQRDATYKKRTVKTIPPRPASADRALPAGQLITDLSQRRVGRSQERRPRTYAELPCGVHEDLWA